MCGISGFTSRRPIGLGNLKAMTDIIRHRGPDDEGYAVFRTARSTPLCLGGIDTPSEAYSSDLSYKPVRSITASPEQKATLALGHRRLSILDLSVHGHQPMCSSDGALWISYNGEIYNYLELRTELNELGHRFHTGTDTEVILAAYREWGEGCLDRFIGMWAFAIYDSQAAELFLARDRFGIKPLYYWFDPDDTFYFGSEIKQFTACKGWEAKLNGQRAYDYLVYSLTDHTDETMFDGVFQLQPGHCYKESVANITPGSGGKIESYRWYNLERNPSDVSFEEASSGFESRFKEAVRLHLRSDVPVGSALSGGLDSSAIVCEINNLLCTEGKNGIQKTFSSCSEFKNYDERKWMDIVVRHTEMDAHYTYPKTNQLHELTSTILWHQDEPYQSQSAYLGYHVFQLAREQQVKVLLNGQGADEYLGGYGQFDNAIFYNFFKKMKWGILLREIRNARGRNLYNTLPVLSYLLIPEIIRNRIVNYFSTVSHIKNMIDMEALGASTLHPFQTINADISSVPGISRLNLFYTPLAKYLRWEDRNSMAHSIEARVPFLDHRLVEYTYNLPSEYLFSNGTTKRVMREGLRQILPSEIADRKDKKGFITPEEQWVKHEDREMFRSWMQSAIDASQGIIKREALDYFDDMAEAIVPFDYTYIRLILFSEWVKVFKVKSA